ncbi:MAG: tryptophan--tRNA ligase [Candidatus Niyogibacteria bacterium CG10_big_fil_rev_8_21_14_0_10_42_19]|uniref:Tryptophan--tRNA ligase n=1 Tax=Candidatus Niyogibacteria bacterium CG10_big_fil_rev_8_21_14_0_10_42_19 TaxID=1974725 RepID=A0A2H0TIQ2_9BACT|nr:MAG: tryptophan--tRNA ligase [Candidatus Niyogibacteria bacterium CG10_big_fil_rev_8_21_14_0_10_42_19]
MKKKQTVFSGVQPTGVLHIGNYLGAIRQFVDLQYTNESVFCVVDHHAITVPQVPEEFHENTLKVAMLYIACGIDPKESIVFIQSHSTEHTELAWILNTMTPLGELERMTQFKEKTEGRTKKEGVLAGILNYPTLMAADILLYQTDIVPVGEDQVQHIEFTRMLAEKFNSRYGRTFSVPEAYVQRDTARIMGLDDASKKMSKSAPSSNNYIGLLDSPNEIRQKIAAAATDSGKEVQYNKIKKPAISNLIEIYSAFAESPHSEIEKIYKDKNYYEFKNDLAELLIKKLAPIQEKYKELTKNKKQVLEILYGGSRKSRIISQTTLSQVKEKMGYVI